MVLTKRDISIATGESLTGYTFNDAELLWEAEQASGSSAAFLYPEGNKRLAMIGDVVLKLVVLLDLRPRNMPKGSMNKIAESIVGNTVLERIGRQIHLDELVNNNQSQQGIVSPKTLADTFEAILGAVYLDSGKNIEAVRLVMANLGLWPQEPEQLASL
ncbi:hypothetical protein V500_09875 [Pseudogymnoascus sp. VKM F-4518 (FW-2643)]|nr:hypothetical protein V500_09875 [Pseudogymnoascus sp. VKM F-4518 (FW-2643)]